MFNDNQRKIFDLLIEQEKVLSRLYRVFADKFPEHGAFWKKLAREENQHASWLLQLGDAVEKDVVLFNEGKIKVNSLETFITGVEKTIASAQDGELEVLRALVVTADLERSLIEKNAFSCFEGISQKAVNVINSLVKATKDHLNEAETLLRQARSS